MEDFETLSALGQRISALLATAPCLAFFPVCCLSDVPHHPFVQSTISLGNQGSGMETPFLALKALFGAAGKADMLKHLLLDSSLKG